MSSSLTWLDHDAAAGERSMRMLAFFKEREARDELGIGGIRDSIADQLFPGTSTIQTRLRYFLFIPWLFEQLEVKGLSASAFPGAAREAESRLLRALVANEDEGVDGIIGRNKGSLLKRQPSSVYWAGLATWGLRRFDGSLQQYMAQADQRRALRLARRRRDDEEYHDGDTSARSWHPQAVSLRSASFPEDAEVGLTRSEAEFLLERWRHSHPDSLLTWLALDLVDERAVPDAEAVWSHPRFAEFPPSIKTLITHAEKLAAMVHGAALLYNLQLAELDRREELCVDYARRLNEWAEVDLQRCAGWTLEELWPNVLGKGHSITPATQRFLADWTKAAQAAGSHIPASDVARRIVKTRERALKGSKSRFDNTAARKQWGGAAGTMRLTYRWPVASLFLKEWHAGWRQH